MKSTNCAVLIKEDLFLMNVLFLTHQGGIAGSTYSIAYLAAGLAQRGHAVYIGCRPGTLLQSLCEKFHIHWLPMSFRHKLDVRNMWQIARAVSEHNIELINAQSSIDRYTSILSRKLFGFKALVVHTRRQMPKSSGFPFQSWFYTHGTAKIVAVSSIVKQALIALGIPDHHIVTIANGTPREKYNLDNARAIIEELKKYYQIHNGDAVVGCVSRPKQQEQLLEALCLIARPLTVFFIGCDEKPNWQEYRHRFPAPHRLYYLGVLSQEQVLYHYKLFNLKVLPSSTEGLSQALLEAMAMGVPVIASDAGGNRDLVKHGHNGLLFKPGDCRQLAEFIELLLDHQGLRFLLIENALYTAFDNFSIERTVDSYETLFKNLLGKNHEK